MPDPLRIAVVTDIAHRRDTGAPPGANPGAPPGTTALDLLGRFRDWVNVLHPDVVVDLGDRIDDGAPTEPERATRDVASVFDDVLPPCVHLAGDHELAGMTLSEAESAIGRRLTSHSRDVKGWHLTFWNAAVDIAADDGFVLLPSDLDWLAEDLEDTELPCLVFSHIPLDGGSTTGDLARTRDRRRPDHYRDGAAARAVIAQSGKVALCVAGHAHRNALGTIGGTHFLTLQALAATDGTRAGPAGAMTLIEIGERIEVHVRGDDPMHLALPIRRPVRRSPGNRTAAETCRQETP